MSPSRNPLVAVRTVLAATLAVALTLPVASASAGSRRPGVQPPAGLARRMPAALVRDLAAGIRGRRLIQDLTTRAVADASSLEPTYVIRFLAPMPGSPYQGLQFSATRGPRGEDFAGATYRSDLATDSNAFHLWQHRAPAASVHVGAGVRSGNLHLDSSLASANLAFAPGSPTRERTFGCDAFFARSVSTVEWTRGRMQGSFSFTPGPTSLGAQATSVKALIEKITPTGKSCPPPPRPDSCRVIGGFGFATGSTWVAVFSGRWGETEAFQFVGGRSNYRFDLVLWFPLNGSPFTRSPGTATVDFADAGPFLSGQITFARSGPREVTQYRHCKEVTLPYAWSSGSVDVNFDPWTVNFTGAGVEAYLSRFVEP